MNNKKLVINPDKTHMTVIGTKMSAQLRQQVSMMAGGFCIRPNETEKFYKNEETVTPQQYSEHMYDSSYVFQRASCRPDKSNGAPRRKAPLSADGICGAAGGTFLGNYLIGAVA